MMSIQIDFFSGPRSTGIKDWRNSTVQAFNLKFQELLDTPSCQVRQPMLLIGLLTATKTSPPGPAPHETHPVVDEKIIGGLWND